MTLRGKTAIVGIGELRQDLLALVENLGARLIIATVDLETGLSLRAIESHPSGQLTTP